MLRMLACGPKGLGGHLLLGRSLRLKGLPPEPELHQTSPIMLKSESGDETPAQVPSAYFSLQQPKCSSTFSGDGSEDAQRWLKDYKRIAQYNRWDNPMCLANAIFFLAGTARQWYENNEDVLTSWEVFQRALGETFGQQEEEIKKAEGLLKIRAQKANESSESYIQDVLYLCQLIDPRMDNETKLGHLMKGVAEDVYQILIARDVDNVEQFLSQCRKIEFLNKRRITTNKFERLPNVTSMACEEDDLSSLIRRIVQEEVQRAFAQPMHTTDSLEEIIREEVKKNLAPISRTTTSPMMKQPRPAPTYDQAERTFNNSSASFPKAREWRTPDDRPVCFHCGRPGHVVRYCREWRQIFANVRTRRDARRPLTLGDYVPNADGTGSWSPPNRGLRILSLVDSGADYSVISEDFRCRIRTPMLSSKGPIIRVANSKCVRTLGKGVLRIKVNELTQPFEFLVLSQCSHCVILGWEFLKLTQAEINCEHDELYLKDAPMKEEPHPVDTFHTLKDNIIPPNSFKQITVVCSDVPGVQEVAITCSKGLTLEKEIVIPASIVSLNHGRGKVWMVNGTNYTKIIPGGMKVAELSIIDNSYVCCLDGDDDYLNQNEDKCSTQHTGDLDRLVSLMDTNLSHEDRNRLLDVLRRQRPYRVSPYERGVIQTEVDKMLISGIIKPSDSPWSSPVVLVKKKDGTWRFCVDYRRLNKITRKDVYPLPRIDDTLDSLKGASVFPTMDLKSGRMKVLGHLIDGDGIYPEPDKVEAVRNFPRPKNVSEVRSFLGLCSYYRRFIKSFADLTGPLNELLKKGKQFSWNDSQEDSFDNLKSPLTSVPVLGHFDEAAPIYLHTDASGFGIGSVLVQLRDGCEESIAYASRTLSKSEKNYSTTEKECLAVKIGMDLLGRFPPTRDGNRWVIVCTDYLTKYAVTKAIPTGGAVEVAKFMVNDVVLKHGAPRELITDRGRSFQAKVVNELTKMCGMSHYFTTAYHPQTNGLTERVNKTLVDMLSIRIMSRTSIYTCVSHLMMDAEEAWQLARLQTLKAQDIDKERYDSRHKPVYYDVGDRVWVFTPVRKVGLSEKLLKKYFGPYRITKKLSDVNYEVTTVDESRRKRGQVQRCCTCLTNEALQRSRNPERLISGDCAERYWKTPYPDCSSRSTQYTESPQDLITFKADRIPNEEGQIVQIEARKCKDGRANRTVQRLDRAIFPHQETTFEVEETSPPQGTSADTLTQFADAL
ncbi:K02A2.6-like, partial [Cordylochernes scorpioides]